LSATTETLVRRAEGVSLPPQARSVYEQEEIAKFLATCSADGDPNVTLIVSQIPVEDDLVVFGEFMMVKTLRNIRENPKVASIAVTEKLDMAGFKGTVEGWTKSGPYVERINSIPFFRYNAYAGIHNLALLRIEKLLEIPPKVSFASVGAGFLSVRTRGAHAGKAVDRGRELPAPIAKKFNSIMSIKVLAYAGADGYPDVVPVLAIATRPAGHIVFEVKPYNSRVRDVKPGNRVALNVLTMDLFTYQVKGTLEGFKSSLGAEFGVVNVEEAYSCIPPLVGERII